ncbi:MAG: DUF1080 domain-containing protein [Gemmatimonadota bacterium]|nr:DUF1080 domain-containing protein [Gemmatimonadota bacterium]
MSRRLVDHHGPRRAARGSAGLAIVACAAAIVSCARADGSDGATEEPADVVVTETDASDAAADQAATNRLTGEEADEGFVLLFDGESLEAWRGFRRDDLPAGWSAIDGVLTYTPGVGDGDIITRETFTDFDLRLEWKLGPGGNSGVFFGVVEDTRRTYESGPEMQILDDDRHPDGQNPLTSAGSNYALHAPSEHNARPVGEWNEIRIVRRANRIEQWMNGVRVVEYEIGTDEWKALVAGSKFARWPDYGIHPEGHLGLQDHGNPVEFRNIRIRRLDP